MKHLPKRPTPRQYKIAEDDYYNRLSAEDYYKEMTPKVNKEWNDWIVEKNEQKILNRAIVNEPYGTITN